MLSSVSVNRGRGRRPVVKYLAVDQQSEESWPWLEDPGDRMMMSCMNSGGCQPMHGGAGLLMDILASGIGSEVMVLMRAGVGGIKARSPRPPALNVG